MKIGSLIEVIVFLALCMGAARWYLTGPSLDAPMASYKPTWLLKQAGDAVLPAAAVAGCFGVWLERARRRGPPTWDVGRWAWSVIGISTIFRCFFLTVEGIHVRYPMSPSAMLYVMAPWPVRRAVARSFLFETPILVLALGLTYAFAGPWSGTKPDAREWAGRAFAVVVLAAGIPALLYAMGL